MDWRFPNLQRRVGSLGGDGFRETFNNIWTAAMVKGFGCRQAYESLSCRNPRATVDGYGDFDVWPMSTMARSPLGSARVGADRRRRCASARFSRRGTLLVVSLLAGTVTIGARGSVAVG